MKYQLILWDFDGTLADTLEAAFHSFNQLAARHGFAPIDDPASVRNMTTREFLTIHQVPLWRLPSLVNEFLATQRDQMKDIHFYAGMKEVVRTLRSKCASGIVSSNSEENIRACLQANGVEDCFQFIAAQSRLLGKDRAIRRVIKDQQVTPGEVLYVGDEVRDIEAAQQLDIAVATVTWGVNSRELLADKAPDYLIDQPEQLLTAIA